MAPAARGGALVRILVASDSFKGSLTAREACAAIEAGLRDVWADAVEVVTVPMADGGEGTVAALVDAMGGEVVHLTATGPLGDPVPAFFGLLGDGLTAAIEMAAASGLPLVPPHRRDPTIATTRGTGDLIAAAIARGVQRLILGIGGSATNDAGAGVAQALGYRLLDGDGRQLGPGGLELSRLDRIEVDADLRARLLSLDVRVACDVDNPLCGPEGASAVYGPQKGATSEQVRLLDTALARFAAVVERDLGVAVAEIPGAGAAGGLGAGLVAFLGGGLERGFAIVAETVGLREKLAGADLCITGEGRLDRQTAFGKTPAGVADLARALGVPVVAIGGAVDREARPELEARFDAVLAALDAPVSLEDAMRDAAASLRVTARQVAKLVAIGRRCGE
jgi:glycerate kinase